jgi:hypothetical protein
MKDHKKWFPATASAKRNGGARFDFASRRLHAISARDTRVVPGGLVSPASKTGPRNLFQPTLSIAQQT